MILMFLPKTNKQIKSTFVVDQKTKHLLTRIKTGQIAVIQHPDIDEIAAQSLIEKKVKAVINFSDSMTGTYPTIGLKKLIENKIPVFDVLKGYEYFNQLRDDQHLEIDRERNQIFVIDSHIPPFPITLWTMDKWENVYFHAAQNLEHELNRFIDNTLQYAAKEKSFVLKPIPIPSLKTRIKGKHVVVVVRGNHYREDLTAIHSYIEEVRPVLIGVDGGADALIEHGFTPDIIIGDMDSVSDKALHSGAELIVHAYPDGTAPGLLRIEQIGLKAKMIPSLGTSEDIAMLLAYEKQAEIIVALGAHSNMIDFLEKGRKGMASTMLVRMKIGTKLIDAKGVSKLYQPKTQWKDITLMGMAALTPIMAISMINHDMLRLLEMMWMNIKMLFT